MLHPKSLCESWGCLRKCRNCTRADALLVLNSVMAAAPQHVAGTYLLPALQHYAHLLAPSQRARSVKAGSIKSLLEVQPSRCLTSAKGRPSSTCGNI